MIVLFQSCVMDRKIILFQNKTYKETEAKEFERNFEEPYRIKPGDQLYIKVYSIDPKTSKFFQTDFPQLMNPTYLYLNSYKVDKDGFLSYFFIDKMYVKGLTVIETQSLIQETLNKYFKESSVFVKLVNFQITVLGEITNPGTFEIYKEEITIFEAIGRAGGFTDFSNVKHVKLVRETPNGSKIYNLDLTDNGFLESKYMKLQPNDIIYVDPRKTKRFIFSHYPYGFTFGITSTILTIYILINDNF